MARARRHGRSTLRLNLIPCCRALRHGGDEKMDDFFRRLKANDVHIVDGNSVVRDLVARREVSVGLTDTDDVNVGIEDGQPIAMVLPDKDGLGVPVMRTWFR
jgi:ABC-type Fe3+ transport system substrate-binding protein